MYLAVETSRRYTEFLEAHLVGTLSQHHSHQLLRLVDHRCVVHLNAALDVAHVGAALVGLGRPAEGLGGDPYRYLSRGDRQPQPRQVARFDRCTQILEGGGTILVVRELGWAGWAAPPAQCKGASERE